MHVYVSKLRQNFTYFWNWKIADKQDASSKMVTLNWFEGFCTSQKPAEEENATDQQRGAENKTASTVKWSEIKHAG
ncbi:hypothetical protein QE152_g25088 [Popillia japonica]|uniref:Uncharacterized protein n=1 Tax=Popillia japonica TaxID=7064 RepID=A0AAW1K428_POPJA